MCGFVSTIGPEHVPESVLDGMRDRLAHRGPDGACTWIRRTPSGWIGLGHRRLSIIDLSHDADQPMLSDDGQLALVYNGEIYNYIELRDELRTTSAFRTRSDTEVLLRAYEKWGVGALERLNGMFSFALWDGRSKQLLVARDRFGEKPLYWTRTEAGTFLAASEMKALFAHPAVVAQADEERVASYLEGRFYEDDDRTMFTGIKRLEQAHALLVDADGTTRSHWRYWTPDYTRVNEISETAATTEFAERLSKSVRMRLRSDVPVGTSLSGGLDSSAIVCLVAGMKDAAGVVTQNTFSGRFDNDPALSEGPWIDLVTAHSDTHAHSVTPDPLRLIDESQLLHWHQEEPFLSASIYLQWCVMRLASEQRTTVLLDGQGADELLAGYQSYFPSHQLDLIDRWRLVTAAKETGRFTRRLRAAAASYPESARRFNAEIALTQRDLALAFVRRRPVYHEPYTVGMPPAHPGMRLRRQLAEQLLFNSLPMLLRYADRNAMAFSRETRFPFLDHELVEWCMALPNSMLVRDGWQKYVLRKSMAGVLPPETQWRVDKVGYAAPLDNWLRGPLRDWAHDRIFTGAVTDAPGYSRSATEELWSSHQSKNANTSWALWKLISLSEWLELIRSRKWSGDNVVSADRGQATFTTT